MEDTAKRPLGLKSPSLPALDDAGGSPLLLFSVAASDDSKELVVVHSEAGPNTLAGVRISAYQVDDSTEAKEKAERIAKEKEELLKREAARFKARMERMEREKAQRREQRRVDLERKRKFLADDAPNVLAAKLYMDADDEMIIIRRVHKETIALEKEVFFSDL
jgi:predicted nuclease with TOPRIM domain